MLTSEGQTYITVQRFQRFCNLFCCYTCIFDILRDWSLIKGRGGYKTGGGRVCEVLPLQKGGAEKVLAMLKGGAKSFNGRFYTVALSFSHIEGRVQKILLFKEGHK